MEKRKTIVAPSVLSADFSKMESEVASIEKSGSRWIHLDVMDGNFVPNITFGPKFISDIRPLTGLVLDTHLMIGSPERYISDFAKAGSDYITIHAEATVHIHRVLQQIRDTGCKAGISIVPSTPVSAIEEVLSMVDLVLVMTVNPGFGGQTLIESCLAKISRLRDLREKNGYGYLISVDGGVSDKTFARIREAGADVLVSGSSFFKASDKPAYVRLLTE